MRHDYRDLIRFIDEVVHPDIKHTWKSKGFLKSSLIIPLWYTVIFFSIVYLGISALVYAFLDLKLKEEFKLWQWARLISTQKDAIAAIKADGRILKYLKNYHSNLFVIHAVAAQDSINFKYLSKDVLDNIDFISGLLDKYPKTTLKPFYEGFKFFSDRVRSDKWLADLAIHNNILNLKFLGTKLKNDKAFVCSAIEYNCSEQLYWEKFKLTYIPKKFRSDRDILGLIVVGYPKIVLTTKFLKASTIDLNFFRLALQRDAGIYKRLPEELKLDKSLLMAALNYPRIDILSSLWDIPPNINIINLAPPTLRDDCDIAEMALVRNVNGYKYFSLRVRKIKRIGLLAVKVDVNNYKYLVKKLQRDPQIINKVIKLGLVRRKGLGKKPLDRPNIKLLLKQGIAAKRIYKYVYAEERRSKYLYVEALNAEPQLIKHEKNIKKLLALDFSELNLESKKYCFDHFKNLLKKSKEGQRQDILEIANLYKRTAEKMLLPEELTFSD